MASDTRDPVLIKKYGNRRLYDTRESRYITLEELARIVQAGHTVRVVEAASEKDITRAVLMQVILELQAPLDLVPAELLHTVIRVQGTLDQAPFTAFLSLITRQLGEPGQAWARQLTSIFPGLASTVPGAGTVAPAPSTVDPAPPPAGSATPPKAAPSAAPDEDLGAVRQRMSAVLDRLNRR
jgi:polyhydroxyalkanoate synthesis repressor PhaR